MTRFFKPNWNTMQHDAQHDIYTLYVFILFYSLHSLHPSESRATIEKKRYTLTHYNALHALHHD